MSKIYEKSTLSISLSRKFRLNKKLGPTRTCFKGGFTLLEILLVVGIISLLAGIVIIAINPGKQLATVRNTQRKSDLKQLNSAITQYYISEQEYPADVQSADTLTEICDTGNVASTTEALDNTPCDDLVNLSTLVPTYITAIPKDPQGPNPTALINTAYAATGGTGYYVMKDTHQKLVLNTERAELGTVIAIGTTTAMVGGGEEGEETLVENTSLLCSNASDDDEDGDTDCTDTDCANIETCIVASLREGLVGYWPLDETLGTTANDESDSGNNGTLLNGVLVNQAGKVGQAMSFDGTNDYITMGDANVLDIPSGASKTICLWTKTSNSDAERYLIDKSRVTSPYSGYSLTFRTSGGGKTALNVGAPCCGSGGGGTETTSAVNNNTWKFVCGRINSLTSVNIFVNGILESSANLVANTPSQENSQVFSVGYRPNLPRAGGYFQGLIDEIAVWNRALTNDEISDLYNSGNGRTLVQ